MAFWLRIRPRRDEASRAQDHRQPVEMRLVDEVQDAGLQPGKGLLGNRLLVLLGLEIPARQQRDQVLQLAAPELRRERHAQHVGVGRVVEVVVDVLQPAHLRQELGCGEGLVALLDARQELRRDGKVAEIVDRLAQHVAAIGVVRRDLRHGEVGLAEGWRRPNSRG